jgi:hypothetical protein
MTLQEYLQMAYPEAAPYEADRLFAEKIKTSRQNISRLRAFERWPRPAMVALIREGSGGLVTADDHLPPKYRPKSGKKARRQ